MVSTFLLFKILVSLHVQLLDSIILCCDRSINVVTYMKSSPPPLRTIDKLPVYLLPFTLSSPQQEIALLAFEPGTTDDGSIHLMQMHLW